MHCKHRSGGRGSGAGHRRRLTLLGILLGLGSLAWLLCRVVRKPSRLFYPCQQAALANVSLLLGLPLAHWLRRRWLEERGRSVLVRAGLGGALILVVALSGLSDPRTASSAASMAVRRPATLEPPAEYRAEVYVVEDAGGPSGTHHEGVDRLVACLGAGGVKLYRSATLGPESGPSGIVGSTDVVLIKVNAQWNQRGGTNTDVLKGLIARVLEHPDGFTGEVVVVENTQGAGTLDWPEANAEDHSQSAFDVVSYFAALGRPVSAFSWDTIRSTSVAEFDQADLRNGYVVGPYLGDVQGRVSYPKFRTTGGRYVSLKYGLWNPAGGTYDDTRLTFLTLPVLKCHGAVYGVTACTKIHVGTMTTALSTSTHSAVRYGMLGKFLGEVRMPDLNILDCIYILARPSSGPPCTYAQATYCDKLVAGVDPVAIDMWATKNILVPAILANGYTSYPMQDPDNPSSIFRLYVDAATSMLLAAGVPVTNDLSRIDVRSWSALDAPATAAVATARSFPNPSRAGVTIVFDAPRGGRARLEVFDIAGRSVSTVETMQAAGVGRRIFWDGRDGAGRPLSPGTYCYRVSGVGADVTGKTTLVR